MIYNYFSLKYCISVMGDILPLKDALIYVIFSIVTPSLSTGSSEKVDF